MAESQKKENGHEEPETHDPHYEPIISLPKIDIKTLEEDEEILFKMRAKLFRLDQDITPHEWKERGVGDVKILQHKCSKHIRLLMRREKVLKLCANHMILPDMELVPNCGSDRAWLWNTPSDYSGDAPCHEVLAIRFANSENAQKFKEHFDSSRNIMEELLKDKHEKSIDTGDESESYAKSDAANELTEALNDMTLKKESEKVLSNDVCIPNTNDSTENTEK